MPTYNSDHTPPAAPEALDQSQTLSWQSLQDGLALDLVKRTFNKYQIYRWNNHDRRWNANDALYYGYIPQRFWEGTTVPRASLSVPVVFDQVESALPAISNAIFQGSTNWFATDPLPGTSLQEAKGVEDRLTYLLEHPRDKYGSTARNELILSFKDILIHGNGVVMLEIDPVSNDPVVHWVDLRDLYVDPGAGTNLDEAKAVILRKFLSVEQLDSLRSHPKFKIPAIESLKTLSQYRTFDSSDNTKQTSEWLRGVRFRPGFDDKSEMPAEQTIEVLIYYSNSRIIWLLNRQLVAFNDTNPYGFIPFAGAPCFIVPGRWYAMGFSDVLEGVQMYMQGITNGRLDELALALNPPRSKKRGPTLTPSQSRYRPGLIMEFDNPKEDMIIHQAQNITQDSWQEMSFLEQQAQKRTGMNDMMTSGTPLRSNASRTSLGIQAQMESPSSRLQKIVENIENFLIVPMLYKLHAMDQMHSQQQGTSSLPVLSSQFNAYSDVSSSFLSKPVKFNMLASTRMLTRQKLMQLFPFVAQYLLSAPFMAALGQAGMTVDFMELSRMLQDAAGTKQSYELIRQIKPEEQQARMQPSPDMQTRLQLGKMQADSRLQTAQLKATGGKQETDERSAREILKLLQQSMDGAGGTAPFAGSEIAANMLGK